jgi:hypothetical protein
MRSREFKYVRDAGQKIKADEAHWFVAVSTSLTVLEAVTHEARKNPDIPKHFSSRLASNMERVHQLLSELLDPHRFRYVWKRMEIDVLHDFIVAINSLRVVESAVRDACKNVSTGRRGRPHDRALGPGDVVELAEVYAKSTGCQVPSSSKRSVVGPRRRAFLRLARRAFLRLARRVALCFSNRLIVAYLASLALLMAGLKSGLESPPRARG